MKSREYTLFFSLSDTIILRYGTVRQPSQGGDTTGPNATVASYAYSVYDTTLGN